ncbi:hypothetical protein T4D_15453 [Trichinella pseudospiralis]|uniref:Uncharacterized protein n=1 Tax=Trichinella pseudospiralis TaxID=6337 RepID=A0A0V1FEM3_TRIPS|nr:hypothetical protein T4D_15453 [Trichinella pseudospiralis]
MARRFVALGNAVDFIETLSPSAQLNVEICQLLADQDIWKICHIWISEEMSQHILFEQNLS